MSENKDKLFYLQDTRCVVGNSAMWWALNDRGYTCDIRCAKVWTEEEIKNKTLRSNDKVWPKEDVDKYVQHHIDVQDLDHTKDEGLFGKYPHTLVNWRRDLCREEGSPINKKQYCNACQMYTGTVNDADCVDCGLSKTNGNLDEEIVK